MTLLDPKLPVHAFVTDDPGTARIFDAHGIDYCCRGEESLDDSCDRLGLEVEVILDELQSAASDDRGEVDLASAGVIDLVDNILLTHHAYLGRELPNLTKKIQTVARVHGAKDSRLVKLERVFSGFRPELEQHMIKEEKVLFPMCRELVGAGDSVEFHCGSVRNPISVMVHEHEEAGQAIDHMKELTDGFDAPPDACETYRSLLWQLSELERDLHRHVHKENYLLFPKAIELEDAQ